MLIHEAYISVKFVKVLKIPVGSETKSFKPRCLQSMAHVWMYNIFIQCRLWWLIMFYDVFSLHLQLLWKHINMHKCIATSGDLASNVAVHTASSSADWVWQSHGVCQKTHAVKHNMLLMYTDWQIFLTEFSEQSMSGKRRAGVAEVPYQWGPCYICITCQESTTKAKQCRSTKFAVEWQLSNITNSWPNSWGTQTTEAQLPFSCYKQEPKHQPIWQFFCWKIGSCDFLHVFHRGKAWEMYVAHRVASLVMPAKMPGGSVGK